MLTIGATARHDGGFHRVLGLVDRGLAIAVEVPAAVAVLAEVVLLFVGVMSRYVFHTPIVWSDELASIIFLWLAMLGSVIAMQRGRHMRLDYLAGRLPAGPRAVADVLAAAVPVVFAVCVLPAALDYAVDQSYIETPALAWSGLVRAAAMPAGLGLIALAGLVQVLGHRMRDVAMGGAVLLTVSGLLWAAAPWLTALGNWNLLAFFVLLLGVLVLSGMPIAFGFALSTVAYLLCTTQTPLAIVVGRMDEGMSGLILLAVPLFPVRPNLFK